VQNDGTEGEVSVVDLATDGCKQGQWVIGHHGGGVDWHPLGFVCQNLLA